MISLFWRPTPAPAPSRRGRGGGALLRCSSADLRSVCSSSARSVSCSKPRSFGSARSFANKSRSPKRTPARVLRALNLSYLVYSPSSSNRSVLKPLAADKLNGTRSHSSWQIFFCPRAWLSACSPSLLKPLQGKHSYLARPSHLDSSNSFFNLCHTLRRAKLVLGATLQQHRRRSNPAQARVRAK